MIGNLWLPETSREEYDEDHRAKQVAAFADLLRDIDPRLDLIWVKPNAVSFPVGGRWYIRRKNEGAPDSFWVVQNEDGSYCEPDGRHLEALKARDMHAHPDVYRRHREACDRERKAKEKAHEEKRREFREKLTERLAHNHDVRIAVPKGVRA